MKNRLKIFCIVFILIFHFSSALYSNEIKFEAENIETIDKNLIIATKNIILTDNYGNKIYGDKLTIKDEKIYTITDNVIFDNVKNSIQLNAKKVVFNINENIIKTIGDTKIKKDEAYFINTSNISYDLNSKKIISKDKSLIEDLQSNKINIKSFNISLLENVLKADEATIIDKNLNKYEIKKLYYDFEQNEILGKDTAVNQNNQMSTERYLPRAKGRFLLLKDGKMLLKKSVYTNCKKRDGCAPWSIKAEEVEHDKENKIVKYKKASFRFFDVPVVYFPKFFHPDPTVKRQSGFLAPSIISQNSSNFLKIPYFFVLSESSDFTFSPRFYNNQQDIYQGEYRKISKNANHIFDASIKTDNGFFFNNDSSKSHFFSKSTLQMNFDLFDYSKIDFQFQNVSNDEYLKTYDINSPIINSNSTLNSKIRFEGLTEDFEFTLDAEVYEDLTKKK